MLKQSLVGFLVAALAIACSSSDDASSGTGTDALYAECSTPNECQSGLCLTLKQNLQNKTGLCTQSCNDDGGCAGGRCVDLPPGIGGGSITKVCLASCTTDTDCKNGFVCTPSSEGNVCLVRASNDTPTSCTQDSDCKEAKAKCISSQNSTAKACTHALDAPDIFERECSADTVDACPGLTCLPLTANAQNKTGICTLACKQDADCPNASCVDFGTQKLCLGNCTTDTDCKNGYICVEDSDAPGTKHCFVAPK
jgi:hypothetical protein